MSHCFKLSYKTYRRATIFGENLVKKNKNKFKIVYNNKEYALKEFFEEIDNNSNPRGRIKFKLRIFHNILNLSEMFFNCYGLLAMKDDAKVNKEQIFHLRFLNDYHIYILIQNNKIYFQHSNLLYLV